MRAVRAVIAAGLLLLAVGFAVGTEPQHRDGRSCGTVLLVRPDAVAMPQGCATRVGGPVWLGTWLPIAAGGLLVVVGTTAWRERGHPTP